MTSIRATESNDSEVVGLEVPSLIDSPAVRTALDDLLRDIGKGPSVCRDLPDEMEYQFRNLDIHNPKHYYDPGLYNADTQPSIFTGVTHGFEIPTKVLIVVGMLRLSLSVCRDSTPKKWRSEPKMMNRSQICPDR